VVGDAREIIPAALDALAAEITGPRLLFGHSMGGAMALDYALAHSSSVASVVVCAPAVRSPPPQWWKVAAARLLRIVAPHMGISHGLPIEALSRDGEVVALFRADPLVQGSISAQLYFDLVDAQCRILAGADSLSVPTLLLAGTADQIVDWTGARDVAAAAQSGRARFVPVDGAFHELLNDIGRDEVVGLILEFWKPQLPS
jgi:alpha-beta hydrolase superfamily lysophospholipase